jgi:hypothetical protein
MTRDDAVMKNKSADLTNLPAKPCLKSGPSLPRLQPPIFSTLIFVISNEVDGLDKQVWLVQLVLAARERRLSSSERSSQLGH